MKKEAAGDRERNLNEVIRAVKCVRRWVDRGVRSSAGDMRQYYKRRIRRAQKLGYASVLNRFKKDDEFRAQMSDLGWDWAAIEEIDKIGGLPLKKAQGARGISATSTRVGTTDMRRILRASPTQKRGLPPPMSLPTFAAGKRPSIGRETPKAGSRIGKPTP